MFGKRLLEACIMDVQFDVRGLGYSLRTRAGSDGAISETLFGLIMVLTFICTLGAATAGDIKVQTILIGALGCNLAWGIVDRGLYLLARINERGG